MLAFTFRNVQEAYSELVPTILYPTGNDRTMVVSTDSRNGHVNRFRGPVGITYTHPTERVLLDPQRDANPFFHLYEAMWMLAGRNDVDGPAHYAKNMRNFSDDGKRFHGAYGYRWRNWFGYDQLPVIIDELKSNPTSRRCVLQMWEASAVEPPGWESETLENGLVTGRHDLYTATHGGKDVPCNVCVFFEMELVYEGGPVDTGGVNPDGSFIEDHQPPIYQLNMTVCNRSNDLVWGALGANYVHFTFLQEYMASAIGVEVGTYTQFSNNLHIYLKEHQHLAPGPYEILVNPKPLLGNSNTDKFDEQVADAVANAPQADFSWYSVDWLDSVFVPAMTAHFYHRNKERERALAACESIRCGAWHRACREWLERRYAQH